MLEKEFFEYCNKMMEDIQRDEMQTLEAAAEMIADALANGHNFYLHDRGHLIGGELISRAGGPSFIRKLDIQVPDGLLNHAHHGSRKVTRQRLTADKIKEKQNAFLKEYVGYVFDMNGIMDGDVLLLNSNSGYGLQATVIAEAAKDRNVKLIVMSSKATADAISPQAGGKKLSEFADLLFDNHAPYGDAVFEVSGLEEKLWPASGMGAVFIGWPLILRTVEKMLEKGISPTIYRSINIPGGVQQFEDSQKRFEELGY